MTPAPDGAPGPLGRGHVHVWRFRLDAGPEEVERARELLSDDERARADRFHFDRDRRRYTVARARLRSALGGYLRADAARIVFAYGPQGKPFLPGRPLDFNLSHSEELALLAVASGMELGLDVEAVREGFSTDELAERFFSEAERAALARLGPEERVRAFFGCWTCKEAILKGVGGGLSIELDRFDVAFAPFGPARLLASRDPRVDAGLWSLHEVDAGPGFAAAAAAAAGAAPVTLRRVHG